VKSEPNEWVITDPYATQFVTFTTVGWVKEINYGEYDGYVMI
jgi:hypothetical protein